MRGVAPGGREGLHTRREEGQPPDNKAQEERRGHISHQYCDGDPNDDVGRCTPLHKIVREDRESGIVECGYGVEYRPEGAIDIVVDDGVPRCWVEGNIEDERQEYS